jgi:hypothetical protein
MLKSILRLAVPGLAAYGTASLMDRVFHDRGATIAEMTRVLPGDDLIPDMGSQSTMAITIDAPVADVWPWLVQMGCDRAGWYGYDYLNNGGVASATRILPEFQDIAVGYVIPADTRNRVGFPVLMVEPERALVLGKVVDSMERRPVEYPGIRGRVVWSFILEAPVAGATRLIVRTRSEPQPLLERLIAPLWGVIHAFMQRKQLRSIKHRVESRIARRLILEPRTRTEVRAAG